MPLQLSQGHAPAHLTRISTIRSFTQSGVCLALLWPLCLVSLGVSPIGAAEPDAADLFARRILPILKLSAASSCTECHFNSVELRQYIHKDQAATFAALCDEGLIDVDQPDKSKLLHFIRQAPQQPDPLLAKIRRKEHEAFLA